MYFRWQTAFNCIVSWPIQENVVYFKSTSFPALGKALAFHAVKLRNFWQNLFVFAFFFPCVCYPDMFPPADRSCTWSCSGPLVPMRLLICLSPGIRACHSVSHLGHAVSLWGRLYLTWAKDLGAQGTFFQEQPCCGQPHHLQAPH